MRIHFCKRRKFLRILMQIFNILYYVKVAEKQGLQTMSQENKTTMH